MSLFGDIKVEEVTGEFQAGGNMEPIPNNTNVLACADEIKWDSTQMGEFYVSVRWAVLEPAEYKGRKIFQKLWIKDDKPNNKNPAEARKKAQMMLAAIDKNAGGLLASSGGTTDADLTKALVNKLMIINLQLWEMEVNGEQKSGNWVAAVSPRGNKKPAAAKPAPAPIVEGIEGDIPG
ncbi:MAG: hypothetical protein V3R32_04095, partial [Nitrosomonadaceae bacterium]